MGFVYPPLYFWVSAAVSAVTGDALVAARWVSLVATVSSAGLIAAFVWRETANYVWAVLGAAFFLTTYELGGKWFHLARVDNLYFALLLGALFALRFARSGNGAVAAGVLFALAFLTKQSGLVALLPAFVVAGLLERRRGMWALGAAALVAVPVVIGLQISSKGWFWYYVFELPGRHPLLAEAWMGFFRNDMLPVSLSLCGIALLFGRWADVALGKAVFYGVAFAGVLLSAFMSRLHSGGYLNVLIPAFGFVTLLVPMAMAEVEGAASAGAAAGARKSRMFVGALAALAVQLTILQWDVAGSFPAAGAEAGGAKFTAFVTSIPGDVLIPDYQGVTRAGKPEYGLGMAARDVMRSTDPHDRGRAALSAEVKKALEKRRFSAVILSEPEFLAPELTAAGYHHAQTIDLAPKPLTGWPITPQAVWVPR